MLNYSIIAGSLANPLIYHHSGERKMKSIKKKMKYMLANQVPGLNFPSHSRAEEIPHCPWQASLNVLKPIHPHLGGGSLPQANLERPRSEQST